MAKNGTSNHGTGLDAQRLTTANLSNIPRRNNILFLSDYLQEQHSYANGYASEGLTTFSSWPKTTLAKTSTDLEEFLLGTPVLKARVPAVPVVEISSTILKALDSTGGPTPIIENQASRKCTTGSRTRAKEKFPGLNVVSAEGNSIGGNVDTKKTLGCKEKPKEYKKRTKDELGDSDEERLKRLRERRERKRLKKSIMMKSPSKASESENHAQRIKKKASKKEKTKSPMFALMHGFTATNVGKSRITLGPLFRNVGVFKKGRASSTSKTGISTSKKWSDHDVYFSEARFLGSARAKAIKNIDFKSSASSSSSGGVHKMKVAVKRKEKLTVPKRNKRIDEESVEVSDCHDIDDQKKTPEEDHLAYDPANSISWDIERESYVEESEVGCRQGTIVLSFPRDAVACEKSPDVYEETPVVRADTSPSNLETPFFKTSGDSLHPSQSASQVLRGQLKAQVIGNHEQPTFSKYFVPENITSREADGHEREDEGRRSITLPEPRLEKNPKRSMFRQSPARIEASPTLSQMLSLNLVDELPRPYDAFSLVDVRNIFECAAMELDGYDVFHGPDAAEESDFRLRSDNEHDIAFEPGPHSIQQSMLENLDSDNAILMEQDFDYEDPLVEDSSGLPDECYPSQNLGFIHGGCDGVTVYDWNVDHGPFNADNLSCERGDTFSGVQPSDTPNLSMPSVDSSSEYDNCVGPPLDLFSQGRSLLYGLHHGHTRVSDAEAEVAKLLKQNHWLPHRL